MKKTEMIVMAIVVTIWIYVAAFIANVLGITLSNVKGVCWFVVNVYLGLGAYDGFCIMKNYLKKLKNR